jgi:small subunit ribosomal protein S8
MSVDAIGDFLTIIRNALMASKSSAVAPYSNLKYEVARILVDEGFIRGCSVVEREGYAGKQIKLDLKYVNGESVIHEIKRISTPGCRQYAGISDIKPVIGGLGITIISTNRGILTNKAARGVNVGGEVLCTVW